MNIKAKYIPQAFHRKLVVALLLLNMAAYMVTSNFFSNRPQTADAEGKKDLISRMYTGWQMLDWSFSLIEYFRNVGDRKN